MDYWGRGFSSSMEFQALALDEDMEEFRSEKSVKTGKSPEEIEKLMVDESLTEMERACLLIGTGQDVQKICVIEHLPDLLQNDQMETLCRILPKLCDILPSAVEEVQVVASQVFGDVVKRDLIPMHIFVASCLDTILTLLESRDPAISSAWLGTVLACIPSLPKDELKRKILTVAFSKGQLSQTVASRQASCRILGAVAPRFEPTWLKSELLPLATTLCQDVDSQVRQLMCQQLNLLGWALGSDISEESLFPELAELLVDEEIRVRVAALEAMTELISLWSVDHLKNKVAPHLHKICETALNSEDAVLVEGVARLLGRICHEMKAVMPPEEKEWFLKLYCQLSQKNSVNPKPHSAHPIHPVTLNAPDKGDEYRRLCAFNFPAMLLFVGGDFYKEKLKPTFERLAKDDSWRVRRVIACGIHEVANILGENALMVSSVYQNLLKDSSIEVITGLIPNLPTSLQLFAKASNLAAETRHPGLLDFIGPLQSCDSMASSHRQWRIHNDLLGTFKCLITCMTSDQIYSKFVPLVCKHITGKTVLPVKKSAAYALCVFIRYNRRNEQRNELITWLNDECAKSPNCRQRLLFIDICKDLLELFSRSFFKSYFWDALLHLAQDPVSNIRLRVFRMFPDMKSILKLPADRLFLQNLELTVRKHISQERDPDASQTIRVAVMEMDRIEVTMETMNKKSFFESDIADQKKEEEERMFVLAEEKEREKLSLCSTVKKVSLGKPSPREIRNLSLGSLTSNATSVSPSLNRRSGKQKSVGGIKTFSASTGDVVSQVPNSPTLSPAHNKCSTRKHDGKTCPSGSPPVGEKGRSLSTAPSLEVSRSGGNLAKTASGSAVTQVPTSKSVSGKKKAMSSYGLEYSTKAKKRT